jgi:hypothetical protein
MKSAYRLRNVWTIFCKSLTTMCLFCLQFQRDFQKYLEASCCSVCKSSCKHIFSPNFTLLLLRLLCILIHPILTMWDWHYSLINPALHFRDWLVPQLGIPHWVRAVLLNRRQPLNVRLLFMTVGYLLPFSSCLAGVVYTPGKISFRHKAKTELVHSWTQVTQS